MFLFRYPYSSESGFVTSNREMSDAFVGGKMALKTCVGAKRHRRLVGR